LHCAGPQLGAPAINVTLPSDRLHPHLLGNTAPSQQQQPYLQLASGNHTQSQAPFSQQQLGAGGTALQQRQQPQYNHRQQQAAPGMQPQYQYQQQHQAAAAGGHPPQQQQQGQRAIHPSLQALLSISVASSTAAVAPSDTRKRKAEDDHGDLFSLLPQPAPSATAAPSTIPQQASMASDVACKAVLQSMHHAQFRGDACHAQNATLLDTGSLFRLA
jgi:hypothetical protein